jgi:hypothetical protein
MLEMLSKLYRALPPGGVWLLTSAALFAWGSLVSGGSGNRSMGAFGIAGALVAVLVVIVFGGRGSRHRR